MMEVGNPSPEARRKMCRRAVKENFSKTAVDKKQRAPCIAEKDQKLWDVLLQKGNVNRLLKVF